MGIYGGQALAAAFQTVRANTITIAEDIPAEQYGFKPTPEVKSVGEQLAHIAVSTRWQVAAHGDRVASIDMEMFSRAMAEGVAAEQALKTKDDILRTLRESGAAFVSFLDSLSDETLAEPVSFPPPVVPSSRSRFEMLLSAKEHEMHHRAQLMVYERLLGIVPHLTRRREERMRSSAAGR